MKRVKSNKKTSSFNSSILLFYNRQVLSYIFVIILIVFLFILLGTKTGNTFFLKMKDLSNQQNTIVPTMDLHPSLVTVGDHVYPSIVYTVKEINPDYIILAGKNGDMYIGRKPGAVTVKRLFEDKHLEKTTIKDLKIGQKVKIEAVAGESATIYILQKY